MNALLFQRPKSRWFNVTDAAEYERSNSRPILVTAVENQEGVGLAKKVLLVQLVGTQLHSGNILRE